MEPGSAEEQLPSRIPSPAPLSLSTILFPASGMQGKAGTLLLSGFLRKKNPSLYGSVALKNFTFRIWE